MPYNWLNCVSGMTCELDGISFQRCMNLLKMTLHKPKTAVTTTVVHKYIGSKYSNILHFKQHKKRIWTDWKQKEICKFLLHSPIKSSQGGEIFFWPWSFYSPSDLNHMPPRCSQMLCCLCGLNAQTVYSGVMVTKDAGVGFFIHWCFAICREPCSGEGFTFFLFLCWRIIKHESLGFLLYTSTNHINPPSIWHFTNLLTLFLSFHRHIVRKSSIITG